MALSMAQLAATAGLRLDPQADQAAAVAAATALATLLAELEKHERRGTVPPHTVGLLRSLLDRAHDGSCRYEREDPETGVPLPPGVDGYRVGRR